MRAPLLVFIKRGGENAPEIQTRLSVEIEFLEGILTGCRVCEIVWSISGAQFCSWGFFSVFLDLLCLA